MELLFIPVLLVPLLILGVVAYLIHYMSGKDTGTAKMREVAVAIRTGARAYLRRQNLTAFLVGLVIALILYLSLDYPRDSVPYISGGFLFGALCSMLAGYMGMSTSTMANVRTTQAARSRGLGEALKIAFRGGAVNGLAIMALSILGVVILYLVCGDPMMLVGFGFGASLIGLFAQVGGGIYTKSADVGADLVGKLEEGIPEDDPRNPAVIADLVGDSVGDCAGRGADIFESYSDNNIGMMILGAGVAASGGYASIGYVLLPLVVGLIGLVGALVGVAIVGTAERGDPMRAINRGYGATALIVAVGSLVVVYCLIGGETPNAWVYWVDLMLGLGVVGLIGLSTQYYTSYRYRPVKKMAEAARAGPAINIIMGMGYGMESTVIPMISVVVAILVSFFLTTRVMAVETGTWGGLLTGFYGIGATTLGMLSMTAIVIASDTYGPITDNAAGIAEMSGLRREAREALDGLDAIGNTTKALTKGYAMGCAALSAFILFAAFIEAIHIMRPEIGFEFMSLINPKVIVGLLLGGLIPYAFSAMTIKAVATGSFGVVAEVRRQFDEIAGLREGKKGVHPDYVRCVDISTKTAIKKMTAPTLLGVIMPLAVGLLLGPDVLGAFILSATISGALLAIYMFNAGGAWDNAKKYIEAGHLGGKGTPTHAAAVIGDMVGDPLKDTSGPSLHILIKLINIVALTYVPVFVVYALL